MFGALRSACYSLQKNCAGYLLIQELRHVLLREVHDDLKALAAAGKIQRIEGFKEIRALSHAMSDIGLPLKSFMAPEGLIARPLLDYEVRVLGADSRFYIVDTRTNECVLQVPEGMNLGHIHALVSISGQGPTLRPVINYLLYSKNALMMVAGFDVFHRVWNDIKRASKRASCFPWRTLLELTLLYNMNYGPFGKGAWFEKKQSHLQNFLTTKTPTSEPFRSHLPFICRERGVAEPSTEEEIQIMSDSQAHIANFAAKGPLVKLMRWFSWFESSRFFEGDFLATKMILLDCLASDFLDGLAAEIVLPVDNKDVREMEPLP